MASLHIAVFAKAPIAGQVKTRLIPLLGAEGAAAAYRQMLLKALQIASDAALGQISLWISGSADHPFLIDCSTRFSTPRYQQSDGDLGDRMATCLRHLLQQHERVLLIGSDCPVLSVADLQMADAALRDGAQIVFTPAEDGGYVLVGMRRLDGEDAAIQSSDTGFSAFEDIAWSADGVMAQTRERLAAHGGRAGCAWAEMPMRWDVDVAEDYVRAVRGGVLQNYLLQIKTSYP
jgi:rSAM/selenodomain-associated transferase 1